MHSTTKVLPPSPIQDIFPLQNELHTHGSNIIYFNNSLFVVWFQGNGERTGTDVSIYASFKQPEAKEWQSPFLIATNGLNQPDINPAILFRQNTPTQQQQNISIFWGLVHDQRWEGTELHNRYALVPENQALHHANELQWQSSPSGDPIPVVLPTGFAKTVRELLKNTWPLKDGHFHPENFQQKTDKVTFSDLYQALKNQTIDITTTLYEDNPEIDFKYVQQQWKQDSQNNSLAKQQQKIADVFLTSNDLTHFFERTDNLFSEIEDIIVDIIDFGYKLYDFHVYLATATLVEPHYLYHGKAWETRCNPLSITLSSGQVRLLLPLYSDKLNYSLVVYSDDNGRSWQIPEQPIVSRAGIQPSLVQTNSGQIVAYMRNNASILNARHALHSISSDHGNTWQPAIPDSHFQNSSTSLAVLKLTYGTCKGQWVMVYNKDHDRTILMLAISNDEGKTWQHRELFANQQPPSNKETFSYPSLTQTPDPQGLLHISFSHYKNNNAEQTIGYAVVSPEWIAS